MTIKLGSYIIDPLTKATGWVTRFIGPYAICKADDHSTFKVLVATAKRARRPPKPIEVMVRVLDAGEILSPWMRAEKHGKRFVVVDEHPNWHGARLLGSDVEIANIEEAA